MSSYGKEDLESFKDHGDVDISGSRGFMIRAEEFVPNILLQHKGMESDAKPNSVSQYDGTEKSHAELGQKTCNAPARNKDLMCQNMTETENHDYETPPQEAGSLSNKDSIFQGHNMPNLASCDDKLPRFAECNTEKGGRTNAHDSSLIAQNDEKSIALDPNLSDVDVSGSMSPQSTADDDNDKETSDSGNHKEGKYFYYDTPLPEETGIWIPVSVPPMTEHEREEWTKGFCSNGGYIPEEDFGWGESMEKKDLTMWDVVVEMLLVARGKVNALASGDIAQISWISAQLIEQAWNEMAQTLTETNINHTQEILESEPPRWLPDSTSCSCMLCGVRFHPIMCTRHHCRFCGGIFCSECTKGRSLLPEKFRTGDPQRVCDVCCVRLESVQPYLMNQVSHAAQLPTHDLTDLSTLRSWVNFPWGQSMEYEIYKATNTIRGYAKVGSLKPEKRIPETILRDAKGLAIITVVKVGMMVTYNIGTGLVVARREDGLWSPPSAISSFGVGWGAQAGGELTDFIIVLRTNEAVENFCSNAHFSIGAGLSAAAGIIGRTAEADVRAGPSGFAACYTYSCSKGAFIGCSLEGSVVTTRARENCRFYGSQSVSASQILLGSFPRPPAAATLYRALGELYQQLEG